MARERGSAGLVLGLINRPSIKSIPTLAGVLCPPPVKKTLSFTKRPEMQMAMPQLC